MRAVLKPKVQSPHAEDVAVTLLARTGGDKIVVERVSDHRIYSVYRFRLCAEGLPSRRISDAELATLPWRGKGPDREKKATGDLLGASGAAT